MQNSVTATVTVAPLADVQGEEQNLFHFWDAAHLCASSRVLVLLAHG